MNSLNNILSFIELKGYSVREFEQECGIANGTINNSKQRDADLTTKNIEKISKRFGKELIEAGYYIADLNPIGKNALIVQQTQQDEPHVKGKNEDFLELTPGQIMSLLAKALDKQADAFAAQAEMIKSMEKRMAREETLARIEVNLNKVFGGLETIGERQDHAIKKILSDLEQIKGNKRVPLKG